MQFVASNLQGYNEDPQANGPWSPDTPSSSPLATSSNAELVLSSVPGPTY
jgi:hypothetical protein